MNAGLIYQKTAKGMEEVAKRSAQLSMVARRLLIMIDGKKDVAALSQFVKEGEFEGVIQELESGEFIEAADVSAAPSTPAPAPAPSSSYSAAGSITNENFVTVQKRAVREIFSILGPDGDRLAIKIEACRRPEDLQATLVKAEEAISALIGRERARKFMQAVFS